MTIASLARIGAMSILLITTPSLASDEAEHGSHNDMDHSTMAASADGQAVAKGVVNSIDMETGVINVTHEPVEALGWPMMTMDLATTRRVDLSAVETGQPVTFTLKQGRDKQFRVIAIEPVAATE